MDGFAGAGVLLYAKSHRQVDFQLRLRQPLEASQVSGLLFLWKRKLKEVDETVVAVESRAFSRASSSSPEVDEVVDGCVASSESRQLLLDAVVDVHAMSEGWGDYFGSLVGSHQFVASGKSQLNDSKVQG